MTVDRALSPDRRLRRVLTVALVATLAVAVLAILRPLFASIAWALILAYVSWPAYLRLSRHLPRHPAVAAAGMTMSLAAGVVLPIIWAMAVAQSELIAGYHAVADQLINHRIDLPSWLRSIPGVGEAISDRIRQYAEDPQRLQRDELGWLTRISGELVSVLGGIGRNLGKLGMSFLTLFFLFRDGAALAMQVKRLEHRYFGARLERYWQAAGAMARAVVFGLLITSLAQGAIAGVGYWVTGVRAPVLFAVLTAMASIIPVVGTLLIWGPLSAWLLATGQVWQGLVLLAWGALLVHPTDNILRPIMIGTRTGTPFLLVMFGVVGGLATIGLLGLFVGPITLAIAAAVWREWVAENEA
jgi:predicted PurR-regulated permease PerM